MALLHRLEALKYMYLDGSRDDESLATELLEDLLGSNWEKLLDPLIEFLRSKSLEQNSN